MKIKVALAISLVLGSFSFAQQDSKSLEDKISDVTEKYLSSEAPFKLHGKWQLLIPKSADPFKLLRAPLNYSESFQIWDIYLDPSGEARLKYPIQRSWENHSWEHSWGGPKFYIRLSNTEYILKFTYFVSQGYIDKEPSSNTWEVIKDAWEIGQIEAQIGELGWQAMSGNITRESFDKQVKALESQRRPPNKITLPIIMTNMLGTKELGSVFGIITRRDVFE